MKVKFNMILLVSIFFFSKIVIAQEAEEINNLQLKGLFDILNYSKLENADNIILQVKEKIAYLPELETYINFFVNNKTELSNKIKSKSNLRDQIDLSVSSLKISGIVESKEKGYAIVNSNGNYYAIKSDLTVGNNFNGNIKPTEGTILYKPLGRGSYSVQTYVLVSGTSPQEQYSILSREVNELKKQYDELWNKFKSDCIQMIQKEIDKNNNILLERHYLLGQEYLNKKEYDKAFNEFSYVKSIDANYKDVSDKLDLANNKNHLVRKSSVYQIISPERQQLIIGTSYGIFKSLNDGKTWKLLKDFDGKSVYLIDVVKDKILLAVENVGVYYSTDGGQKWELLNINYNALYDSFWDERAKQIKYRGKIHIYQPYNIIKEVRLVPYNTGHIISVKYWGQEGRYNNGRDKIEIKKDPFTNNYYLVIGKKEVVIPESIISIDDGKSWIPYWSNLFGLQYYYEGFNYKDIERMIKTTKEYTEYPENAVDLVVDHISDEKQVDAKRVRINDYSLISSFKKEDNDPIIIVTNYGIYKTCWDCDHVDEIKLPSEYKNPISIFYDKANPNTIIVGFVRNGLIISRDNGKTWEDIYSSKTNSIDESIEVKSLNKSKPSEITKNENTSSQQLIVDRFQGTWKGIYNCSQGETGLTLEITALANGKLTASFSFYPTPSNPNIKSGSYVLEGNFETDGSFILRPKEWLEQPFNYVMVGMSGQLDIDTNELRGKIIHPSCSDFRLTKSD